MLYCNIREYILPRRSARRHAGAGVKHYTQKIRVKMRFWVEVTGGDWGWTGKVASLTSGEKRGLKAPATVRYANMMSLVRGGDIVLTHLTSSNTSKKEWQSSLVGVSTVTRGCYQRGNTLYVDTKDDLEFPVPIRFSEYRDRDIFSDIFQTMIKRNFQKYLFEITPKDFCALVRLIDEDYIFLQGSVYSEVLKMCDGPNGSFL